MGISNSMGWATVCATLFLTTPALSQTIVIESECDRTEIMGSYLLGKHSEKPLALGTGFVYIIYGDGVVRPVEGMFTLWTNQESGTFTNTISFTDGITCLVMSGTDFEPYVERK